MISRVLSILGISVFASAPVSADELTGLWNCEFVEADFTGQAKMSFQIDGNVSATLSGETTDQIEAKITFSIQMLWAYRYENNKLSMDPLRATDAQITVNGENNPEMAKAFKAEFLTPETTTDIVAFQGDRRMTLTDEDGVMYCQRAKRCPDFSCPSN